MSREAEMSISLRLFLQKTVHLSNLQYKIAQNLPFSACPHTISIYIFMSGLGEDAATEFRQRCEQVALIFCAIFKIVPPAATQTVDQGAQTIGPALMRCRVEQQRACSL
jgi:hypothetical protein